MNKTLLVSCLLLVTVFSHTFSENTKVKQDLFLEKSTTQWKDEINAAGPVFVLLYQTWCGHCKNFIPVFDKTAEATETGVTFVAVDCSKGKQFCQDMGVKGYPTIYYIKDYENFYKFQSARTQEGVEEFLKGGYEKVDRVNFDTFAAEKQEQAKKQAAALEVFKEKVPHLNKDTFFGILDDTTTGKFVLLYAPWCGHCKNFLPAFTALHSNQEGKQFQFYAMDATGPNQPLGKLFGLKGFPTLVYVRDGQWYKYAGQRNEKAVEEFCESGYLKATADGSVSDVIKSNINASVKGKNGAKTEVKDPKIINHAERRQKQAEADAKAQTEKDNVMNQPWSFDKVSKLFDIYTDIATKEVQKQSGLDAQKSQYVVYGIIFLVVIILKKVLLGSGKKVEKTPKSKKE